MIDYSFALSGFLKAKNKTVKSIARLAQSGKGLFLIFVPFVFTCSVGLIRVRSFKCYFII